MSALYTHWHFCCHKCCEQPKNKHRYAHGLTTTRNTYLVYFLIDALLLIWLFCPCICFTVASSSLKCLLHVCTLTPLGQNIHLKSMTFCFFEGKMNDPLCTIFLEHMLLSLLMATKLCKTMIRSIHQGMQTCSLSRKALKGYRKLFLKSLS